MKHRVTGLLVCLGAVLLSSHALPYNKRFPSHTKVFHNDGGPHYLEEAAWQPASFSEEKHPAVTDRVSSPEVSADEPADRKVSEVEAADKKASGVEAADRKVPGAEAADRKVSGAEATDTSEEEKAITKTWMYWNSPKASPTAGRSQGAEPFADVKDPCAGIFCHPGRVCQVDFDGSGVCQCGDAALCAAHHMVVCGTDGIYYPSHCELHRIACVTDTHISIDDSEARCISEKGDVLSASLVRHDEETEDADGDDGRMEEVDVTDEEKRKTGSTDEAAGDGRVKTDDDRKTDEDATRMLEAAMAKEDDCTKERLEELKMALLRYHCTRIGQEDCSASRLVKPPRLDVMFSYYDTDGDDSVSANELETAGRRVALRQLSRQCRVPDLMTFEDTVVDKRLSRSEFYAAFTGVGIGAVTLDDDLREFTTHVTAGGSVELKCNIEGASQLVWKRNGAPINEITGDDIKVFYGGSLFISNLMVHHTSNYTCEDIANDQVVQTHILRVQVAPTVRVSPVSQVRTSGTTVVLKCRASGVPRPEVDWQFNDAPLRPTGDSRHRYVQLNRNVTLEILEATSRDNSGVYKCRARNAAGMRVGVATVVVKDSATARDSATESFEAFAVFHDEGYTILDARSCYLEHRVEGQFAGFARGGTGAGGERLCAAGRPCSWGAAVNVRDAYVYATQPAENRVVVVDVAKHANPAELIVTDNTPVAVWYIEHLDQVWVVCAGKTAGTKTTVVIRNASKDGRHRIVHPQPMGDVTDLLSDLFLPPNNDVGDNMAYGYAVHSGQQMLFKLDLKAMQYTSSVDLRPYGCLPKSVSFLPIGGRVIVTCGAAGGTPLKMSRLTVDYLTDRVLETVAASGGGAGGVDVYVSPDGRAVITAQEGGDSLVVERVTDDGIIEHKFDEMIATRLDDVAFFPSDRGFGYNFFATSADKNSMLFVDLESGKVEMIDGVGKSLELSQSSSDKQLSRAIVSGMLFDDYLMTTSHDAVTVIDGRRRRVQCKWSELKHANVIVRLQRQHGNL